MQPRDCSRDPALSRVGDAYLTRAELETELEARLGKESELGEFRESCQRELRRSRFVGNLMLAGVVAAALLVLLVSYGTYIVGQDATKDVRKEAQRSDTRAAALCRKQNAITDTLVLAAIKVVLAPPNPPADLEFARVFKAQHAVLTSPATCDVLVNGE